MKIQVTQQHIDKGRGGSCTSCPVALALNDAGFTRAWVSPSTLRSNWRNGGSIREFFPVPDSVLVFINRFDAGLPVDPFSFELEEQ
jgi:hypothetical protein